MFTELNLPFTTEESFKTCKTKSAGSDYLVNEWALGTTRSPVWLR